MLFPPKNLLFILILLPAKLNRYKKLQNLYYSYFNKELRQVFLAITRVLAKQVFHLFLK